MRLLTTISPAPRGFETVVLSKRVVLSGPVAILVAEGNDLNNILENFSQRMVGVVITPGATFTLKPLSPLAWHLQAPAECLECVAALAPGWLSTLAANDASIQRVATAELRAQRLLRELGAT